MSKHLRVPHPSNSKDDRYIVKSAQPPYSIPGVHLPNIEVHDNLVNQEFHKELYDYLLSQVWYINWPAVPAELQICIPNKFDEGWALEKLVEREMQFSRCLFGSDEDSIKNKHPLIYKLWEQINSRLDNKYELTGSPEGMVWNGEGCPPTTDPTLKQGWRVYANGSPPGPLTGDGYPHIHRDTVDLTDDTTVTIIWMANLVWYPTWGNEIVFYPEDPDGITGDHQQFTSSGVAQKRNFKIGWPDEGKMVCTKPNRLLIYDGRTLHVTNATRHPNINELNRRIIFRAKQKLV
jgi:hypothetical protein